MGLINRRSADDLLAYMSMAISVNSTARLMFRAEKSPSRRHQLVVRIVRIAAVELNDPQTEPVLTPSIC